MINLNAVAGVLRQTPSALAIASATMVLGSAAEASLFGFQTFNGNVKASLDGACDGDTTACDGNISASVDGGSTVVAAYLYTSMIPSAPTPTATLDGNSLSYTALGANNVNLQAYRADVTSIVKPVIDSGGGGIYNFAYAEGSNNSSTDGSALVVVYENASLPEATVAILDGFSATTGDQFIASFADPIDTSDPDFFAELSLGIGYSFTPDFCGQCSEIDVNGQDLTDVAGNFDDGFGANGGLITVGGYDDPLVSSPPASPADDHERYDLTNFISDGDTQIVIDTLNPSNDDNIFLAAFYLGAEASVINPEDPDVNPVPLPASALLLLAGLGGLSAMRSSARRKS